VSDTGVRLAADGTRLFTHRWPASDPRAAIVLVHGLGEHLGRYDHVGTALSQRGFDVRGSDSRGFGASEGPRAYTDSFETLLDEMAVDVEAAIALGVPVVLLGHSVGGLQALLYATSGRAPADLLILSSPALRNTLPRLKVLAVRALAPLLPRMTLRNPVPLSELSRDQSVGERYAADPLVIQKSTFGLGVAAFAALDRVPHALERLDTPTLVIHGAADRIVDPEISEPLTRCATVERVVFDDFRHESFNEDGGTRAIATVADWIDRQLAAP
jgi:alpha-beta hydrolase superfamily lysophospholipase